MRWCIAGALCCLASAGADPAPEAGLLQGTWDLTSEVNFGHVQVLDRDRSGRLEVAGDRFTFVTEGALRGTITIDEARMPGTYEVVLPPPKVRVPPGPVSEILGRPAVLKGIFKVERGRLTLCQSSLPGGPRPEEFSAEPGSRRVLEVWERLPGAGAGRGAGPLDGSWKLLSSTMIDVGATFQVTLSCGDGRITRFSRRVERGGFRLDASRRPRAIDLTYESGSLKGQTVAGIYAVEGDVLRLCTSIGKARPEEFRSPEGKLITLEQYRRRGP